MNDSERDKLLFNISTKLAEIEVQVKDVHRAMFGNGKPGVINDVEALTRRVIVLEQADKAREKSKSRLWVAAGLLVNAALSIWSVLKRG